MLKGASHSKRVCNTSWAPYKSLNSGTARIGEASKYSPGYKRPCTSWVCMEASSQSILIPVPALLSFLEVGVWHGNFQTSHCGLVFVVTRPHEEPITSPHCNTKDVLITPAIVKDLGALVGTVGREQYLFSISSHSSISKLQILCMACAASFFRWNQAALQTRASITPKRLHGLLSSKCHGIIQVQGTTCCSLEFLSYKSVSLHAGVQREK